MVKKIVMLALAGTTVGVFVLGRDFYSYARTSVHSVTDRVRSEVPLEFEIERARREIAQLLPEVRKSMHLIAEEQVETDRLRKSVAKREAALADQEEAILALSSDLKSGDTKFVYAGHRYSQTQVERDLTERFNRFQILEATLQQERQVLAAKEAALVANRETVEQMLSARKDLEVELERLEARLRTIDARKQINGLELDDSHLSRVRTLIATIEKRLDVEHAVLAAEGDLNGLIPVMTKSEPDDQNIADKVEGYFGSRPQAQVAAGQK